MAMTIPEVSLIVSGVAVAISLWTRIDAVVEVRRERHQQIVTKAGESFIAAQNLKNTLSDCVDQLKATLANQAASSEGSSLRTACEERLTLFEAMYRQVWDFIAAMEKILASFEKGMRLPLEVSQLQAKISRFDQWRILVEFDVRYVDDFSKRLQSPSDVKT